MMPYIKAMWWMILWVWDISLAMPWIVSNEVLPISINILLLVVALTVGGMFIYKMARAVIVILERWL